MGPLGISGFELGKETASYLTKKARRLQQDRSVHSLNRACIIRVAPTLILRAAPVKADSRRYSQHAIEGIRGADACAFL